MALENYGINGFYKGKVLKNDLKDNKIQVQIDDLILSKPNPERLQEYISKYNIVDYENLNLDDTMYSTNSIICRPLYINGNIVVPNVGDTVFVFFFDNDPKKIFYINITNDKPVKVIFPSTIIERENSTEIIRGNQRVIITNDSIDLQGNITINGKKIGGEGNVPTEEV